MGWVLYKGDVLSALKFTINALPKAHIPSKFYIAFVSLSRAEFLSR